MLFLSLGLLVLSILAGAGCASETKSILLVSFDGLRRDHLSFNGYARATTPTLDRLSSGAVFFPDIVATGCSTEATITSLLTGTDYGFLQRAINPPDLTGATYVPRLLQAAGFDTLAVVATPAIRGEEGYGGGFDDFIDFADLAVDYVTAADVADAALRLLRGVSDEVPFFVYLHFEEPHPPWFSPEENRWVRPFGDGCTHVPSSAEFNQLSDPEREQLVALYDDALAEADRQLGRVLEFLRVNGRLSSTVVAVTADHGLELFDRYSATHAYNPYDEVTQTFLLLSDGGKPPATQPLATVQGRTHDIVPTVLGVAGLANVGQFEGLNLLENPDQLPEEAFTVCSDSAAVRTSDFKLVSIHFEQREVPDYFPGPGYFLYDLRSDPNQRTDISLTHPSERDRLRDALDVHVAQADRQAAVLNLETPEVLTSIMKQRLRALGYIQ